ncbi:MAG TPA: hypothetical protein VIH18_33250 [Candidatus Binatia bacterium]|jgi:hypothetical protein
MERIWIDSFDINLKSALRNLKSAILMGVMLWALCVSASAQPGKVPRIGLLVPGSAFSYGARTEAFRKGLRELKYVEGQNINILSIDTQRES